MNNQNSGKSLKKPLIKIMALVATFIVAVCLHAGTGKEEVDKAGANITRLTFKVHHDEIFDDKLYANISKDFEVLIARFNENDDKSEEMDKLLKSLGEPFKNMFETLKKGDGLHCHLSLMVNTKEHDEDEEDSISFEARVSHEEKYNEETWEKLVEMTRALAQNTEWIEKLSPTLTKVINAGDDTGIHISWNDSTID